MLLDNAEIHLWQARQADFNLDELEERCLGWLTRAELQRYRRLYFDRHRHQLLLGRFLTRSVLSKYAIDVAPEDWCFTLNAYGKPALDTAYHDVGLHYNLSHSGGALVLALATTAELGVDIECCSKPRRVSRLAKRYFSQDEATALMNLPETKWQSRFYELWTLKEAYIKACGQGLAIPLQQFSFAFTEQNTLSISFAADRDDSSAHWQFWQLDAGQEHKLALGIKRENSDRVNAVVMHEFSAEGSVNDNRSQAATVLRSIES